MTTFLSLSDILMMYWLFTARWSTWPGNHLVPCVAELVGSCIPIHAHQCLPDPKCLFYQSGLSLCLSVDHFCIVPVDDMVLFHGMVSLQGKGEQCNSQVSHHRPCPGREPCHRLGQGKNGRQKANYGQARSIPLCNSTLDWWNFIKFGGLIPECTQDTTAVAFPTTPE